MEEVFNQWARIKITDKQVKKLVQIAMAPNMETLQNLQIGKQEEFSGVFTNVVDSVLEYTSTSPTQLMETTKVTLFGAYNGDAGYSKMSKAIRISKLKSIMTRNVQATFDLCDDFANLNIPVLFDILKISGGLRRQYLV